MLRIGQSRAFPRVVGFVVISLFTIASGSAVLAKSRVKQTSGGLPAGEFAPNFASPPVRFFTINSVLAKADGRKLSNAASVASANASVAMDTPDSSKGAPQTSDEPFGLFMFRAPEGLLWTKWRAVQSAMSDDNESIVECRSINGDCSVSSGRFISIAESAGRFSGLKRVEKINSEVNNAVRYVSDYTQHGVADLWSSPLATMASGRGDCEDYAILKYALLLEAGVDKADLRLLLVKDLSVRQDHAVLAVRVDGRWIVLDNRRSAPFETADLGHFMPLFALNQQGVNLFAAPYAARVLHESETELLPASNTTDAGGRQFELPAML